MKMRAWAKFIVLLAAAWLAMASSGPDQPATMADQLSTPERVRKPGWWPTKATAPRDAFLGAKACAQCHASLVESQKQHAMAQTAMRPIDSEILRSHELDVRNGDYTYRITRTSEGSNYSVSDGKKSISGPLNWAFGVGKMGQSFVFEHDGTYYLIPYTYYQTIKAFDFTVSVSHTARTLEKAIGLPVAGNVARGCFECHATASTTNNKLDPDNMIPGVTCEACHGPGADHVAAVKAGLAEQGTTMILNPKSFTPADSVDFCGSCHRAWWDVTLVEGGAVDTVRFQPYRLEGSRCWGKGDKRITCVACHDPHKPLQQELGTYDQKCLNCHVGAGAKPTADHPGAACPKATKDCVTCHMVKYPLPDVHFEFTDHFIHVVKAGEKPPP